MANPFNRFPDGYIPPQAFAAALESLLEPDQALVALELHERLAPIAKGAEDVLLAFYALKQKAGNVRPIDAPTCSLLVSESQSLVLSPEEVVEMPTRYVSRAVRFMQSVTETPELIADVFAGYRPVSPGFDWSKPFFDASLTTKYEGYIVAALQLEADGQPRPTSIEELLLAADRMHIPSS